MARRKISERELDRRCALWLESIRAFVRLATTVIKWGGFVIIVYLLGNTLKTFAGGETKANILINLITDFKMNEWMGIVLGGGGMIYGSTKNWQLKQTRKKHASHIKELELIVDNKRQSSRLTPYGETNEDDR